MHAIAGEVLQLDRVHCMWKRCGRVCAGGPSMVDASSSSSAPLRIEPKRGTWWEEGRSPVFQKRLLHPVLPRTFLLSHSPTPLSSTFPPSANLGMNSYSTSHLVCSSSELSFSSQAQSWAATPHDKVPSPSLSRFLLGVNEFVHL